jgi:hypothetical protein
MLSAQDEKIFITREASCGYSNRDCFGSRALTRVRCFENHTSCASYPDGQTNCSTFQRKVHRDVMVMQLSTRVMDLSMCIEHIINPV